MSNEERKVEIVEGGGKKGEGADQAIEMQKLEDIRKEEKEMQEHASGTFPLSVLDLMGLYKEKEMTSEIFRQLKIWRC